MIFMRYSEKAVKFPLLQYSLSLLFLFFRKIEKTSEMNTTHVNEWIEALFFLLLLLV
jgi:hypothetical protein